MTVISCFRGALKEPHRHFASVSVRVCGSFCAIIVFLIVRVTGGTDSLLWLFSEREKDELVSKGQEKDQGGETK